VSVLSVGLSVGNSVHCGKTADSIQMSLGIVGWVGPKKGIRLGPRSPIGEGTNVLEKLMVLCSSITCWENVVSAVQKRLNRSSCRLGGE